MQADRQAVATKAGRHADGGMPGHVEQHGPGKPVRPDAVERSSIDIDAAEQVLIDRECRSGQGRHRQPVGTGKQRLDAAEQCGAVEHRLLKIDTAHLGGERELLEECLAEIVLVIGRKLLEARSPGGVIDGAPDRLDVEPFAGKLLELRAEGGKRVEAGLENIGDISRNRPPGRREAEQDLPPAQIAAQRRRTEVVGHGHADRPGIGCILPRHGLHHQRGVGDGACGWRDIGLIAKRVLHLAVRNDAIALLQPDNTVAGCRNPGRAAAIRRDRKGREAAGNRNGRASARSSARPRSAPGIARAAEQRGIRQALGAELRCRGLADQDGALRAQPGNRHGVIVGNVVLVGNSPEGRSHAPGVDQILHRERDAVKQAQRPAGHDLPLRGPRRSHGLVAAKRDEAVQIGLQPLGAVEDGAGYLDGRKLLADNPRAQFDCGLKAEIITHRLAFPGSDSPRMTFART